MEVIRRLRALDQPITLFGEVRAMDATLRTAASALRATASRPCRDAASSWTCSQSAQCRHQAAADRASLCFCTEPLFKTSITSKQSLHLHGVLNGCVVTIWRAVLQDDAARRARLKTAGLSLQLTDEQKGAGQQNNTLLALQRAAKRPGSAVGGDKPKQKEKPAEPEAAPGPEQVSPRTAGMRRLLCS